MKWFTLPVLLLAALVAAPASALAGGQQPSLAELSRREAERRKAVKAPAKVYTNDDVPKGTLTVAAPVAPEEPRSGQSPGGEPPAADAAPGDVELDEAAWRKRFAEAREAIAQQRERVDDLQAQVAALPSEEVGGDSERVAALSSQRASLTRDLTEGREALDALLKALASLEAEADTAGVPAAWRE
ncbi:MAG: hypothetical protein KJ066_03205 [Acidobacteria bacterium]|nr:hypothetical protein [Acidobacteriota bacterium]